MDMSSMGICLVLNEMDSLLSEEQRAHLGMKVKKLEAIYPSEYLHAKKMEAIKILYMQSELFNNMKI